MKEFIKAFSIQNALKGQSYPQGESTSLALVGHPFSDGVTIRIPCGVDVLLH